VKGRNSLTRWWLRWGCGIGLDRHHVGNTITPKVIRSDDSRVKKVRRNP